MTLTDLLEPRGSEVGAVTHVVMQVSGLQVNGQQEERKLAVLAAF